jgi:hypothetical protein
VDPYRSSQESPPDPIPASYYARVDGGRPERAWPPWPVWPRLPSREVIGRLPGWQVLGGCAVVGGLLAAGVIVLATHGSSPVGRLAASPVSVPTGAPVPAVSSLPSGTPFPVADPPSPEPPPSPTPTPSRTPSPAATAVSILNGPLSARRVRPVTLRARTAPQTTCAIAIGYASAPDLGPATSDAGGVVSWTWRVGGQAPSGTWPVTVSCGGASASTQVVVS